MILEVCSQEGNMRFQLVSDSPKCKYIKQDELKELEEICPECGNNLVERVGRYGKFISCV